MDDLHCVVEGPPLGMLYNCTLQVLDTVAIAAPAAFATIVSAAAATADAAMAAHAEQPRSADPQPKASTK